MRVFPKGAYSLDGINWIKVTADLFDDIAYGNDKFVIVYGLPQWAREFAYLLYN